MRNTIILLILTLSVQIVRAQVDYRSGYYITLNNDTVRGMIKYGTNPGSFKYCYYKVADGQEVKQLTAEEISGYGFPDDMFFTRKSVEKMDSTREPVFMEVLVKGNISLFKYMDAFYIEKADTLYELSNEKYENIVEGKRVIIESNRYIGLLFLLMRDCSDLRDNIKEVRLFEKPLLNLVMSYNKCRGSETIEYKHKKPWTKIDVGALTGVLYSTLNFGYNSDLRSYMKARYHSVDPFAGIIIGFSSPRLSDKISFQTELHFFKPAYSSFITIRNNSSIEYYDMYIDRTTLSIPLSVRYSSSATRNSWFAQAGINWDYNINDEMTYIYEDVAGKVVNTYRSTPFQLNHNLVGYWAGCGYEARFRKFNGCLALRYFSLLNTSREENITAINSRLALSIIIVTK